LLPSLYKYLSTFLTSGASAKRSVLPICLLQTAVLDLHFISSGVSALEVKDNSHSSPEKTCKGLLLRTYPAMPRCTGAMTAGTMTSHLRNAPQAGNKKSPSPETILVKQFDIKPSLEIEINPLRAICNLPDADESSDALDAASAHEGLQSDMRRKSKL
jgi:hypothetical protein